MYPSRFHYEAPTSVAEALDLLSIYGTEAKVLAGGMSLIPLMKLRFAAPEVIIDINNISELDYLAEEGGHLRIGALCRHRTLERSTALPRNRYPTLAAAAPLIADPIVRTRGSLVGSVCHADPQGDWGSVMLAMGGEVIALSSSGERRIPVQDLMVGPFQNSLRPDELAVEARVPVPQNPVAGDYLKLERRVGDFATVGVGVFASFGGASVEQAGIALTGVGANNIKATSAEQALVGSPLDERSIDQAARQAAEVAEPKTDVRGSADYKRHIVHTFVSRAFSAYARARAA
jgi:carbon-monoxide dehydrogenase medium subunit